MNTSIHETGLLLWHQTYTNWLRTELLSLQWWMILLFIAAFYSIWWKLADKSRLAETLLFGAFSALAATLADIAGTNTALWQYNYRLFPLSPSVFLFDYCAIPILLMLAHQGARSWRKFLIFSAMASGFYSFVILPLAQRMDIVRLFNWNFGYTFVLMFIGSAFCRYVIQAALARQAESRRVHSGTYAEFLPQPSAKRLPDNDDK